MAWETTINIAPKHLGVYNRSVFPYPKSRVLGPRAEVGTPANGHFVEGPSVDGSEIRRLPVDMVSIPLFTGVSYIPVGDRRISSINSLSNLLYQATFSSQLQQCPNQAPVVFPES